MSDVVAPEFVRFVSAQRRATRWRPELEAPRSPGATGAPVLVPASTVSELLCVAAKRASGLLRPTKRTEVIWVDGDRELAVDIAGLQAQCSEGAIQLLIPVRCDQTGATSVDVVFAVGSSRQPAGLFASTHARPIGPAVIVDTWAEALVAFAWACLLAVVSGVAGATGKDASGNPMVPVDLTASADGLEIVPMARHRLFGSSELPPSMRPASR